MGKEDKGYWVVKSGNCYITGFNVAKSSTGMSTRREEALKYDNAGEAVAVAESTPMLKSYAYRVSSSGKEYKVREPK